jgi:hypothetical protein
LKNFERTDVLVDLLLAGLLQGPRSSATRLGRQVGTIPSANVFLILRYNYLSGAYPRRAQARSMWEFASLPKACSRDTNRANQTGNGETSCQGTRATPTPPHRGYLAPPLANPEDRRHLPDHLLRSGTG